MPFQAGMITLFMMRSTSLIVDGFKLRRTYWKETFGGSINRVAGWNRSGGLAGLLFGAGILAFLDFILGLPGELSGRFKSMAG